MKLVVLLFALASCSRDADATARMRSITTTPKELFDDFSRAEPELLDRYRYGVTFTATVKTLGEEEPGKPIVWIDVDGENLLMLTFAMPPPRDLKAGDLLTVTCKIGGASGALMMVTDCIVRAV